MKGLKEINLVPKAHLHCPSQNIHLLVYSLEDHVLICPLVVKTKSPISTHMP